VKSAKLRQRVQSRFCDSNHKSLVFGVFTQRANFRDKETPSTVKMESVRENRGHTRRSETGRIRAAVDKIRRLFRRTPDEPEDPYAYLTAPKEPKPPSRGAAAVAEEPDD
jgi:hypothetical protein